MMSSALNCRSVRHTVGSARPAGVAGSVCVSGPQIVWPAGVCWPHLVARSDSTRAKRVVASHPVKSIRGEVADRSLSETLRATARASPGSRDSKATDSEWPMTRAVTGPAMVTVASLGRPSSATSSPTRSPSTRIASSASPASVAPVTLTEPANSR